MSARWRWAVGLFLPFLAVTLAVWLDHGALVLHVDRPVERWFVAHRSPGWTSMFRVLTNLGAPGYMFAGGIVLAAVAGFRAIPVGIAIAVVTLLRPLVSLGVKSLVDRPRPDVVALVQASNASYPSGHALAATVCWLAIPAVVATWCTRRAAWASAVLAALPVVVVMITRMYLGVHWLSDVVGGLLLGLLLLVPVHAVLRLNR